MKLSDDFKPRALQEGEYYIGPTQIARRPKARWGVERDGKKRCTRCLTMLPLDHFTKGRSQCKPCRAARTAGG